MKKLLVVFITTLMLYSCCQEFCEDQQLVVWGRDFQYTDVDTFYMVKYKPGTNFTERLDTVRRYIISPAGGNTQLVSFFEILQPDTDWKIVIPALNKEYFISDIEIEKKRCNCDPGSYRTVKRFRFNNTTIEGSSVDLN